jgi:N-acetylglutamate synthase-like GNAT family acetyltransferase
MIRKARETDADEIHHLAESLSIKKLHDTTKGFLVYTLQEAEYRTRILMSNYFFISTNHGHIDGFLMCYDNNILKTSLQSNLLSHEDAIIRFVQNMPEPYIFGDQICISRAAEEQKQPTGIQLMENLFAEMKKHRINTTYVAILHAPTTNHASIQFCTRIGFRKIEEVKNSDNTTWGIYRFELK